MPQLRNRRRIIAAALIVSLSLTAMPQTRPAKPKPRAKAPLTLNSELAKSLDELLKATPLRLCNDEAEFDFSDDDEEDPKPPPDDAPIKTLLTFWREINSQGNRFQSVSPSPATVERLLAAAEIRPWLLDDLMSVLPDEAATHDRLYQIWQAHHNDEERWSDTVREWLKNHSDYFRDELLQEARRRNEESPQDQSWAIQSLADLDWAAAEPLFVHLDPSARVSLEYERALESGNTADSERLRRQLQEMAAQRQNRDWRETGLYHLLNHEWSGREAWYAGLFADPSITGVEYYLSAETKLGVITEDKTQKENDPVEQEAPVQRRPIVFCLVDRLEEEPEKFIPIVSGLVNNANPIIHEGAVSVLTEFLNREGIRTFTKGKQSHLQNAARPLLPWLTQRRWAHEESRIYFVSYLRHVQLPEALPGLLWILEHDEDADARAAAAEAVLAYRTPVAAPALRSALERETNEEKREKFITALYECGGISDEEAVMAIEAYARSVIAAGGETQFEAERPFVSLDGKPLPLPVSMGRVIQRSDKIRITDGLAVKLFERIRQLRRTNQPLAKQLFTVIQNVPVSLGDPFYVECIGEGWMDAEGLMLALKRRDTMQKHTGDALVRLAYGQGAAGGVATALLDDDDRARDLLKGQDRAAQKALLACMRYLRDRLPVDLVAPLLKDPSLQAFAESYLIVEDSRAARELVWARHPNEAIILGVSVSEIDYVDSERLELITEREKLLQSEIKKPNAPPTIYAMIASDESDTLEVRAWRDRAELRVYEDAQHWRTRALTTNELAELQALTSRPEIEDLSNEVWQVPSGESPHEYVRLSKAGGRRIGLISWRETPAREATLHEELAGFFARLRWSGDYRWQFALEAKFPGLIALPPDADYEPMALCEAQGRLSVMRRASEPSDAQVLLPEWWALTADGVGERLGSDNVCPSPFLAAVQKLLARHGGSVAAVRNATNRTSFSSLFWSHSLGGHRYAQHLHTDMLLKELGEKEIRGLATPDEKWIVGSFSPPDQDETQLIRFHVPTKKRFIVSQSEKEPPMPLTWLPLQQKMLLGDENNANWSWPTTLIMLDPETGKTQSVKCDFRPLMRKRDGLREFQPTGKPDEVWASVCEREDDLTRIGRYDLRNFKFKPQIELPGLCLESSTIWVDEAKQRLWLIYAGHLLRLPLAVKTK